MFGTGDLMNQILSMKISQHLMFPAMGLEDETLFLQFQNFIPGEISILPDQVNGNENGRFPVLLIEELTAFP